MTKLEPSPSSSPGYDSDTSKRSYAAVLSDDDRSSVEGSEAAVSTASTDLSVAEAWYEVTEDCCRVLSLNRKREFICPKDNRCTRKGHAAARASGHVGKPGVYGVLRFKSGRFEGLLHKDCMTAPEYADYLQAQKASIAEVSSQLTSSKDWLEVTEGAQKEAAGLKSPTPGKPDPLWPGLAEANPTKKPTKVGPKRKGSRAVKSAPTPEHAGGKTVVLPLEPAIKADRKPAAKPGFQKAATPARKNGAGVLSPRESCFHCDQTGHVRAECPYSEWRADEAREIAICINETPTDTEDQNPLTYGTGSGDDWPGTMSEASESSSDEETDDEGPPGGNSQRRFLEAESRARQAERRAAELHQLVAAMKQKRARSGKEAKKRRKAKAEAKGLRKRVVELERKLQEASLHPSSDVDSETESDSDSEGARGGHRVPSAPPKGYYVVTCGRTPGIYRSWAEARPQVAGYPYNHCERVKTLEEAERLMRVGTSTQRDSHEELPPYPPAPPAGPPHVPQPPGSPEYYPTNLAALAGVDESTGEEGKAFGHDKLQGEMGLREAFAPKGFPKGYQEGLVNATVDAT